MTIQAVVFDIGGILEITPDLGWGPAWESRLGFAPGELGERMNDAWRGGEIGTVSEAEVHQAARERLGLDEGQLAEFLADLWRDYLGTANTELIEYARGCARATGPGSSATASLAPGSASRPPTASRTWSTRSSIRTSAACASPIPAATPSSARAWRSRRPRWCSSTTTRRASKEHGSPA